QTLLDFLPGPVLEAGSAATSLNLVEVYVVFGKECSRRLGTGFLSLRRPEEIGCLASNVGADRSTSAGIAGLVQQFHICQFVACAAFRPACSLQLDHMIDFERVWICRAVAIPVRDAQWIKPFLIVVWATLDCVCHIVLVIGDRIVRRTNITCLRITV